MVNYPPLPDWVDVDRMQSQQEVASDLVRLFNKYRVVFLQAPTGSGKTLIANLVQRLMSARRMIYTCTTKSLQDQVVRDFTYGRVLKGRTNYPTLLGYVNELGLDDEDDWVSAADCTWNSEFCAWCDEDHSDCPYVAARDYAVNSQLAILNTSYLLTDYHGPKRFIHRELNVIDEADELERELLNFAELRITPSRMRKLNLRPPEYKTKSDSWKEWLAEQALPKARRRLMSLPSFEEDKSVENIREVKFMDGLVSKLTTVSRQMVDSRWVYGGYKEDDHNVVFQPVFVRDMGEQLIWDNGLKFLLMSATILSPDVMATELGIPRGQYGWMEIPSEFPPENRPVYIVPVADMSMDFIDAGKPVMATAISKALERHPGDRALIHCVSYKLSHYLRDTVVADRPLITYENARGRELALEEYKDTPGAVLFAPSMDRGIDLPDDLCRMQGIAKIPFPNLGDERVKARLYSRGGQGWYAAQTIRAIVQMAGRAVRHKGDHAVTYIFDSQFNNLWKSYSKMFPKYFRDAMLRNLSPTLFRRQ